jgi:ribosomal protein L40E
MLACPNCGFTYGWNGTKCEHCHYPDLRIPADEYRDQLVENRILYKATRKGLPGKRTHHFQNLAPITQAEIRDASGKAIVGYPVLVFYDSSSRWTLLTTREVIGWNERELHSVKLADMVSVGDKRKQPPADATFQEVSQWKVSLEQLRIADRHGNEIIVWVPWGSEAYALWGILLSMIPK